MAGVDGSVIIDTKMDLKGFNDGVNQASSKMLKLNNSIQQTEEEISKIKNQMKELADSEVPTAEYDQLTRKVKNAENSFNSLISKREILEESGKTTGDSEWENVNRQIERALLNLQSYEKERDALENKSIKGIETEQYKKLVTQLNKASDKYKVLNRQREEATTKENKIANAINRVKKASEKKFASMFGGSDKASNSIERLTKRILSILGSVFVFTVLNKAFTSLRTYMGDALATNDQFNASLAQIKSNLATAFYPIYQAALPAINALMSALAQITGTIATFIAMLFGTTVEKAQAGASAMQAQADAMSGVGDAAKKAKKQLAGFDDAQVLSKPEETSSTGGGGSGASAIQVGEVETNPKLLAWLDELKTKLEPFVSAMQRLGKALLPFAGNVFKGFIDFIASLLGCDLVVGVINLLAYALENISPETAQNIGKALGALATCILLYKAGSAVHSSLLNLVNMLKTLASTTVGKILISVAVAYIGFKAGNKIYEWLTGEKVDMSIGEQISEILECLFGDFGTFCDAVGMMFDDLGQWVLGLFGLDGVSWKEFKDAVKLMWSDFTSVLGGIPQFFVNVGKKIKSAVQSIPQFFLDLAKKAWSNITNTFSNVTSFFGGIVTKVKNLFQNVGSAIGSAVGKTFASGINAVLGTIESVVNGFINKINSVIGVINKIPGVKLSKISTISLPRLASGTVVPANYGEFLAVLGDNKKETEVVSPLSTMKKAFVEALNEMGDTGSKDIHLTVNIDGQAVYKTVVKYNNRNTKITGKNALAQ